MALESPSKSIDFCGKIQKEMMPVVRDMSRQHFSGFDWEVEVEPQNVFDVSLYLRNVWRNADLSKVGIIVFSSASDIQDFTWKEVDAICGVVHILIPDSTELQKTS